jgi:hypothetical protein
MKRAKTLIGIVLAATLASAAPAEAGFWDWLQEFSGPGPFSTGATLNTMFPCPEKVKVSSETLDRFNPEAPTTCFFLDHRSFDNTQQPDDFGKIKPEDLGVGKVELHILEGGFSRRVHPAMEVGFGGGVMWIASRGQVSTKVVLTAPRVIVTPAMLFGRPAFWNERGDSKKEALKKALKIVKFYAKMNIVAGDLDAADFGLSPSESSFKTNWERVASTGFIIDANELYRLFTGK